VARVEENPMGRTESNVRGGRQADSVSAAFGRSRGKSHIVKPDVVADHDVGFSLKSTMKLVRQTQKTTDD